MPAKTASAAATLLLRRGLIATGPVSATLQIAGVQLVLWARLTFGWRSFHFAANPTQGPLITQGPYRCIRNPIYAAVLLICWTGTAAHWSALNGLLALVIGVTVVIKIACEEKLLRSAYPEYEEYARRTSRLIPFVI
ncbi:MAG TPA: isoprenylcysteine carboxylmethyltransferase family protein [Candidatus Angelobacter sp.]|nr:isoprenylcysteine carboxylmethyltransferase family protein [Candidatus Angelobacter sp.]